MKLAERHEQMVTQYLRDVAHFAGENIAERDRERGLIRLEERIHKDIERLRKAQPDDADIDGVLRALGRPSVQASLLDAPEPGDARALRFGGRVWLGVCTWLAQRTEFPVHLVRIAAVVLGLCTGPLLLIAYIATYGVLRHQQPKDKREPIDWLGIVWRVGATFIVIYLLKYGFAFAVREIEAGYKLALGRPLPELGSWASLRYEAGEYFSYAFMVCVPLAAFSALPLHGGWGKSIFRFSQALVALYAIALSYGTAKIIVGIILDFVKQFPGGMELPFKEFFQ